MSAPKRRPQASKRNRLVKQRSKVLDALLITPLSPCKWVR